jgi:2-polyprenyl-6-methoxyphenol hydroxylase-like FAD-dependent oxidoreductase
MSKEIKTICIVGGGSAGWMSAATITKLFPDINVYLIENPDFKTIGVGESTIAPALISWLDILEIKDTDFMKECDATYKLGIMFKDFYEKDTEPFFYPFQKPFEQGLAFGKNAWFYKKQMNPALPNSDYAKFIAPITNFADLYRMPSNPEQIPGFDGHQNIAYHFDATKFGQWLKNKFIKSSKFKHILEEIKSIETDENGIKTLNGKYTADLFLDCSGFNSILMNKVGAKKNREASKILMNDQAWTAHIPYDDVNKKEEMKPYTLCTPIVIPCFIEIKSSCIFSVILFI